MTHTNESWVVTHSYVTWRWITYVMNYVTHHVTKMSHGTYEWVRSHMNESYHTYEGVISHTECVRSYIQRRRILSWTCHVWLRLIIHRTYYMTRCIHVCTHRRSHGTYMDAPCHTYEYIMSRNRWRLRTRSCSTRSISLTRRRRPLLLTGAVSICCVTVWCVCFSLIQYGAVVAQETAFCYFAAPSLDRVVPCVAVCGNLVRYVALYCIVLHCAALCCTVLQSGAEWWRVL